MKAPKHVLVVDDDKAVRGMTALGIESLGYQVTQAANGTEALRLLASELGDLFAVCSDLEMPSLQGTDLLGMLVHIRRNAFRILMSARIGVDAQRDIELQSISQAHALLAKPFTLQRLREVMQSLERLFAQR